jgi:hypothetical protein
MKNLFLFFIFILSFAVLGCKKHKNDIPAEGVSFNISNVGHWTATTYDAQIYISTNPISGDTIKLLGISGYYTDPKHLFNETFLLTTPYKAEVFNVSIGPHPNDAYIIYNYLNQDNEGISGTVTITQLTATNVQGYFNCVLTPSGWAITNGEFNLPLQ